MNSQNMTQLREAVRAAEFQSSVMVWLLIAAENDKRSADNNLAAARADLQEAEENKRGEA